MRPYDLVGRLGGEEFLVVLPDCDATETLQLGERLRSLLSANPITFEGESIFVTVSFGAAVSAPDAPATSEAIIQAADAATLSRQALRSGSHRTRNDDRGLTNSMDLVYSGFPPSQPSRTGGRTHEPIQNSLIVFLDKPLDPP